MVTHLRAIFNPVHVECTKFTHPVTPQYRKASDPSFLSNEQLLISPQSVYRIPGETVRFCYTIAHEERNDHNRGGISHGDNSGETPAQAGSSKYGISWAS
jgi:hypothetical protein